MVSLRLTTLALLLPAFLAAAAAVRAQTAPGSLRGMVYDRDLAAPLAGASIAILETGQKTTGTDQGNWVIAEVPPGRCTVTVSKDGYVRQMRADVVVVSGKLTELDVSLSGDYEEMEEFVVEESIDLSPGTEAGLLELRFDSPALLDAISADLMSRAGASDAAGALRLVAGATVQDGKSAVIRGLPDRYVSSQLNAVRLPTADEDKRAVELDQFPAAIIESIRVSKTFTPDQQGDASGGAVDVRLRGIPKQPFFVQMKAQSSFNTQVAGAEDFLTYRGGGVNFWGIDDGGRDIQTGNTGSDWAGAAGASEGDPPMDFKWSLAGGGSFDFDNGLRVGGFASFFHEYDSAFHDNGIEDSYWVDNPGDPMTPQTFQGTVLEGDYRTGLFDVTQAQRSVQWGGLVTVGAEWEEQALDLVYLYTRTTEDTATRAEDTRGKSWFFPGYDPGDPTSPGYTEVDSAPWLRLETLEYTERTTESFQIRGRHRIPIGEHGAEGLWVFLPPEADWTVALSSATLDQPDKRQFGSYWIPAREPFPGFVIPAAHRPYKPAANFNLGNLQRIWKEIVEESEEYAVNVKLPFRQWTGTEGWMKAGYFYDSVERNFDQETFSNFGDPGAFFEGPWETPWSSVFPSESHPITASPFDVDYRGELTIGAWYAMLNLPLIESLSLIGGVRWESTELGITIDPEEEATWFPPGTVAPTHLNPGDADVAFEQSDVLPAIAVEWKPIDEVTVRGSWTRTVARQTFKELTPVLQQEYLGAPVFIGNPGLGMSELTNWDVRVDYVPWEGSLVSASWFRKDVKGAIEYVQRLATFNFTTAVNYPEGELTGFEFEVRQDLGRFWDVLEGLSLGANATLIDSEVTLPDDEAAGFALPNIAVPLTKRDMTNAPEHIFNVYLTWDLTSTGTRAALFYTLQGDTLIAGAGEAGGNFVPSLYATQYGTLNLSVEQKIGEHLKLQFQAKNLTNEEIETVYRSDVIGGDVRRTSYTKGIEFALGLSAEFEF